ncbi:MAG: hypothetical protein COB24_10690 [Hyphomicrobiales bacterium]|nr:MAG: hypothetical protein COB24_10690 [Hyphomicrobiales bacterium]
MREYQSFFNSEYILSLFESHENMVLMVIFGSVVLISILLLMFLFSSERKRLVQSRQHAYQAKQLTMKLAQAEAVIASDEQLMMIWPSQDSMMNGQKLNADSLRELGGLHNVIGLPKTVKQILNFEDWLSEEGAEQTQKALVELGASGKSFTFFVKTRAVERVEMSGHVVGQEIIFRIRDLKEDRLFLARANEKWVGLETKVAQYEALLNICPLPTWLRDEGGKLIWVNDAYIRSVEAEDANNVVQDHIELIAPSDVYKARQYFMDEAAGKKRNFDENVETQFVKLDDGRIEQQVFAVIKGERCNLQIQHQKIEGGIVATAFDATKYERIKDELKRYNNAHKQTLDKLKTAIAQFGPDQNLEFYNSSYQELFGIATEFLDSKPSMSMILEEIRNLKKMPEQANFKNWRDNELEAFRQVESSEKWWHLPNGSNLHIIADPHPFGGVTFLYDDVTEHVALASKYNELDQMQSETLDNLTDGVAVFNSDGELQISNPAFAKIWNFEAAQLAGKPHVNKVLDWCEKHSQNIILSKDAQLTENAEIWSWLKTSVTAIVDERREVEGRINCADGCVFNYASIPLPNSSTLMTFTDVTVEAQSSNLLVERNDALVAADQLKSDFISHVSYQFREPLTNILGFSEMLEGQIFGELNKKQLEYVDFIRSSSFGLRALINDILDLASLDADRMELKYEQIDIIELIGSAVDAVKLSVAQKNIILNRIIMPKIGAFAGDAERVSQVLYNLLANAIYFSDNESIVSIGAEKEKQHIRLWVRDAGVGMSAEKLKNVFEKFNSDKPTGAGLGLALVKKLVEFHGGEVKISSVLDKGTIVSCYFPIQQAEIRSLPLSVAPQEIAPVDEAALGSNVISMQPIDAVLPIVSAFVNAQNEQNDETPKKLSTIEQLKLLRNKTKSKGLKLVENVVETVEDEADEADEADEVEAELVDSDDEAKGIFANSRLAALYQRGKNKSDEDKSDEEKDE